MESDTNVKVIINIPDHPHALAAMTKSLDILGQALTDLAAKDLGMQDQQPVSDIPEMDEQGETLHSKEWTEYLHQISTTYELIGERATNKFIELYGPDHPLSRLAEKARSGISEEEFYESVRTAMKDNPDIRVCIENTEGDADVIEDLINRVKKALE